MFDYRSMFDLSGRVALVVGAGSGIGQASAIGLSAFGAKVFCADVNLEAAQATVDKIRASEARSEAGHSAVAEAVFMDIRETASIRDALGSIEPADILVSTPSINVRKPLLDITDEEFDRVVGLNLKGTFLLMREVGRDMAQRGRGSIIAFSSIRAQVVEPGQGVYAATKSGMVQMVRALAAELGPRGVRVNAIAPGVVETPLTAQIKNNPVWYQAYADKNVFRRWAQPYEMVGAVVYLASDASSYVTGSLLMVDGGWTAVDGRFDPPL